MNSESEFFRSLDNTDEPVYLRDSGRRIIFMNRAAMKLAGIQSHKEYQSHLCHELFAAFEGIACLDFCPFEATLKNRRTLDCRDHLVVTPDGKRYRVTAHASPVEGAGLEKISLIRYSSPELETETEASSGR